MSLPYFQFMVDDWLSGLICTHDMETQGVFVNVCARLWKCGGRMLDDDDRNARLLRVDKQLLSKCLVLLKQDGILLVDDDGNLYVKFLLSQLDKVKELSAKRSIAGRKGGQAIAKQKASKPQAIACHPDPEPDPDLEDKKGAATPPPPPPPKPKVKRFKKPTEEEAQEYVTEKKLSVTVPDFFNHYEKVGWLCGKARTPLKDWKAALRQWSSQQGRFARDSGGLPQALNQQPDLTGIVENRKDW